MKFSRIEDQNEPVLHMAPMIDIIFLLLIFFMSVTTFQRNESQFQLTLPSVDSGEKGGHFSPQLIVNISKKGDIYIDKKPFLLSDLETLILHEIKSKGEPSVEIRADKGCLYQTVVDVIDLCSSVGVENIKLKTTIEKH